MERPAERVRGHACRLPSSEAKKISVDLSGVSGSSRPLGFTKHCSQILTGPSTEDTPSLVLCHRWTRTRRGQGATPQPPAAPPGSPPSPRGPLGGRSVERGRQTARPSFLLSLRGGGGHSNEEESRPRGRTSVPWGRCLLWLGAQGPPGQTAVSVSRSSIKYHRCLLDADTCV